jgi:hypothetical protein
MKLPIVKKIDKADLGSDLPSWIDKFLGAINGFIEPVGKALQGQLTLVENSAIKAITQQFVSGTTYNFNPRALDIGQYRVVGMMPINTGGATITGWKFITNADATISITLTLSATATCTIYLILG